MATTATPPPETASGRRRLASQGKALPTAPGGSAPRFPIPNVAYLDKAIRAVGRAKGDHSVVRRYIIKRAQALGASSHIPDNWNSDGSIKTGGS